MTRHNRVITGLALWALAATMFAVGFERARQADQERAAIQASQLAEIQRLNAELDDREQAQEDLRRSVDYGFVVVNAAGDVKEWNAFMEHVTGIKASEDVGKMVENMMPIEARQQFESAFASAIVGDSPPRCWDFVCDLVNRDTGENHTVKIFCRVVKPTKGGEPYAIMVVMKRDNVEELGDFSRRE